MSVSYRVLKAYMRFLSWHGTHSSSLILKSSVNFLFHLFIFYWSEARCRMLTVRISLNKWKVTVVFSTLIIFFFFSLFLLLRCVTHFITFFISLYFFFISPFIAFSRVLLYLHTLIRSFVFAFFFSHYNQMDKKQRNNTNIDT